MLNCATREEALEFAAKIPHARRGTIDVRAVPEGYSDPDNSWVLTSAAQVHRDP
jgi:hypothetical protein